MSRLDSRWDDADERERRAWAIAAVLLVLVGVAYVTTLVTAPPGLALPLWLVYLASAVALVLLRYDRLALLVPVVAGGIWVLALAAAQAYG
jgi:hypothetical protein